MNHLEIFLTLSSLSFQVALCGAVFIRKLQRVLPLFAVYVCVSLLSTICFCFLCAGYGFESGIVYYYFWFGAYAYAAAFGFAVAELCRHSLGRYRGIWALAWRLLVGLSVILAAHAWLDAHGQPGKIAILGATFLRNFAFASIAILVFLLLIRNYYGLTLAPLQRLIAIGMFLTCAVDAVGYTIFRNALSGYLYPLFQVSQKALWPALEPYSRRVNDIWSTVHLVAFMISMGIWCYALRKPLPEGVADPELLPAEVYREVSPSVNLRLAAFNSRLTELLKP